jgi:hypothetical protein
VGRRERERERQREQQAARGDASPSGAPVPGASPERPRRNRVARTTNNASVENGPVPLWVGCIVLLAAVAYLAWFFNSDFERIFVWRYLILPDEWPQHWTGGGDEIGILDRLPIWLGASAWLAMSLAAGWLLLWLARATDEWTRFETGVISLSTGLGILSTWTLLVGLAGMLHQRVFVAGVGIAAVVAAVGVLGITWFRHRSRKGAVDAEPEAKPRPVVDLSTRLLNWGPWIAGLPIVAIYLLAGPMPPTDFDVREYHLQAPKEWFLAGRIGFVPHNVYANMPLGAEMHALGAMSLLHQGGAAVSISTWWSGALIGKTVVATIGLLVAFAAAAITKRYFGDSASKVTFLVCLATTWLVHVSANGLNDGVLALYTLMAWFVAMDAADRPGRWLIAGWLAGCAVATKYTGVPLVAAPVLAMALWRVIRPAETDGLAESSEAETPSENKGRWAWFARIAPLLCCMIGVGGSAGPWLAKNLYFTSNPVYPLLASQLGGQTRTPQNIEQWSRAHRVPIDAKGNSYSLGQLGQSAAQLAWKSPWLSACLWPLAVCGCALAWFHRDKAAFLLSAAAMIGWLLVVWWGATHRIDRFWIPVIPLAAILAGATHELLVHRWQRRILWALVGVAMVTCWLQSATFRVVAANGQGEFRMRSHDVRFLVSLEALANDRPPSHQWLEDQWRDLPPKERPTAILVGDAAVLELTGPVLYNTCLDADWLATLVANRSPEEAHQALKERNVRWVVVDWSELARYRSPGNYGYSQFPTEDDLKQLVTDGVLGEPQVLSGEPPRQGVEVYEVEPLVHPSEG